MMQMLVAEGMTPLADGERQADPDNPRRYLEWERIKQLPDYPECIAEAEGKVVKVISRLLLSLPEGHEYRIIFMERPLCWPRRIRCYGGVGPTKRARARQQSSSPSKNICGK